MKTLLNEISKVLSSKNKNKTFAVAFIALLTLSAFFAVAPASSKTYKSMPDRDTGTVVGASPTLLGLGQQVLINILVYPAPSGPTYYAQDLVGKLGGWQNVSCTITKPDGTKSTFMPIDSSLAQIGVNNPGQAQIVGSLQFYYTPDQTGNYSVSASFPGQSYNTDEQYANLNLTVYYKPSSSTQDVTFAVQQQQVLSGQLNGYPWSPLPTGYWTNPISTNNREWAPISGDWVIPKGSLAQWISGYNDFSTGPNTAHILWANTVALGGLPGGDWGSLAYAGGGGAATVILDGKIYQSSTLTSGAFDCVDLRTGELLWTAPGTVTCAQRLQPFYQTAAQQNEGSVSAWIWGISGSTWTEYNPFNGAVIATITNAPTDTWTRAFSDGSPMVYLSQGGGYNTTRPLGYAYLNLIAWNYSKMFGLYSGAPGYTTNWASGIQWNVSVILPNGEVSPGDLAQGVNTQSTTGNGFRAFPFPEAGVIIAKSHNDMQVMEGFDINTGAFLWKNNATVLDIGVADPDGGPNGPIILLDGVSHSFVAYNVKTGQEQWRASMGNLPWAEVPDYQYVIHNGNFYVGSYDGHVYAYNTQTGAKVWQSDYVGRQDESIYGNQPFNGAAVGAGGILYFSTATTYSLEPRTRFHELVAINETTGHFIWNITIGATARSIADGYLAATDSENGVQYVFGKGQTATTIIASPKVAISGSSVLIEGTVMDQSPGQSNTPCVSDTDMSQWMDYLHGQNATLMNSPPSPNGVPVQLRALSSSGTVTDLGTVTTDSAGHYSLMWNPPTADKYTIYAAFAGSDSYWSSSNEAVLGVAAATATSTSTPTPTSASAATTYDVMTSTLIAAIAIIIAIAIVGILLLRKK